MWNPVSFFAKYLRYLGARSIGDDAKLNVDGCPWRTKAILGRPRPFDPINDPEHARLAEEANNDQAIQERAFELDARQRQKAKHTPRWLLVPALALTFVLEAVSCIQIFAAQGDEMPERAIFGLSLAGGTFILIFFTVYHASTQKAEVSE